MVKGISRRIVVVQSPDPKIFEQAIFIVRDDILSSGGMNSEELLKEAQRVAKNFAKNQVSHSEKLQIPAPVFAAAGAAATGIAWLAMHLVGMPL